MKKITFLFALLCASVMGWAAEYCNTLVTDVNGENPVYLSCYHVSGTTYRIEYASTSTLTITGKGGCNVEVTKSGALGGISFAYEGNKVFAEFESSTTPTKTTGANDVYLMINGEKHYNLPLDIDFSISCGGGSSTPDPVLTEPTTNPTAPTLTNPSYKVLYADNLTPVASTISFGYWGDDVAYADFEVDENTMKKCTMGSWKYAGFPFANSVDASDMEYVHFDVWCKETFDAHFYLLKGGTDPERYVNMSYATAGVWQSYDIPLSSFSSQGLELTDLNVSKIADASKQVVFYFDNFYFYKEGSGSTPDPVVHVYCDSEIGHEASPTAATASFVLLSISSDGEGHTTVTIKQDAEKNSEMFDYLQVTNYAATGSDVTEGGSNKMEVTFDTPTADENGEITLEILWSTVNWGGRWMVQNLKASASATCAAPAGDEEKPSMADASVSVDSKTHNSVVLAISGATDNVAVTKYVIKNHSDNSAVGEYTPAEGKITVYALSPSTAYDWDVYAKDAAGNVSDNCKNITFTTDALASNYCGETLSDGNGATIDMSCEFKNNKYVITFSNPTLNSAASSLAGFNGSFCTIGGTGAHDVRDYYSVNNSERIVLEFDGVPNFYTDLYINIPANNQRTFSWPNDVVWGSCPAVAVTGVSLNHSELEMQVGGATQTLVATIAPSNATNQNVTWASDHPEVASVINGVVTAVGAGTATITVTTQDGSFIASCEVTVTVPSITAATYNGYGSAKGVYALYAITRNVDQSVTFSAKVEAAFGFNKRIHYYKVGGGTDAWKDLAYNSVTGTYDYTAAAGPFVDGEEWVAEFYFPFTGDAASIVCNYTVGSEQAAPASVPVGAVLLNKESNTLSVGETDNLTATVYPSFATDASSITWASSAEGVATVENGTVTAVAAGSANITATCGGVTSAPYVVTVAASLTEAKFYGCGAFENNAGKVVAYDYVFTRATNHKVTLDVVFSRSMNGIIGSGNFMIYINGVNQYMTYTDATHTATYDFGAQAEDASINYYFYFPLDGGGLHQIPQTAYVVGSSNDAVHAFAIGENENNVDALAAADGQAFDKVFVLRSFTAGSLYTLVLPFNADASVLPGQLTKLNNTIVKENGDLKVNFVDADAIEAGVPYLYEPSANVANPVFENVTINKNLNPTISDERAKYYGIYAPTTGVALKAIADAYVLGNDKYLYAASGLNDEQQMKALRGYFVLNFPAAAPGAPKRMAQVIFNGNETETPTDIENVQTSDDKVQKLMQNGQLFIIRDGKMYNAQGQLVK